jgi:hypothetical protein
MIAVARIIHRWCGKGQGGASQANPLLLSPFEKHSVGFKWENEEGTLCRCNTIPVLCCGPAYCVQEVHNAVFTLVIIAETVHD